MRLSLAIALVLGLAANRPSAADEKQKPARPGMPKLPQGFDPDMMADKEEAANAVSVRTRGKGDQGSTPLAEFIAKAKALVESKSTEL